MRSGTFLEKSMDNEVINLGEPPHFLLQTGKNRICAKNRAIIFTSESVSVKWKGRETKENQTISSAHVTDRKQIVLQKYSARSVIRIRPKIV